MQRIAVVGNSGSGKTTLATSIATRLDLPHLELDSVNHLTGWVERDIADFRRIVAGYVAGDRWVVDGNYRDRVGDLVWARADTVVWLDLSRAMVMRQMISRTVVRGARRTELWNGNRELLRNLVRWDPQVSIIRWAWTQHDRYREAYASAAADPAYSGVEIIRLTSRQAVAAWLARLG